MALKESIKVDIYKLDIYRKLNKVSEGIDVSLKQLESLLDNAVYRIYYSDDKTIANKDNMLDKFSGGGGGGDTPTNYITYDEYDESGNVTKATIKNNIIPSAAFSYKSALTECRIIGEITSIGYAAFAICTSLAWTSLPDGVTSIEDMGFGACANLALTKLPDALTSIGSMAFFQCPKLALTELPSGLKSIGQQAFQECTNLTSLTFKGTPDSIASDAFKNCTNLVDIKVPWSDGAVAGAPWGATNATITYDYDPTE